VISDQEKTRKKLMSKTNFIWLLAAVGLIPRHCAASKSMKLPPKRLNYIFNLFKCQVPRPISTVHLKLQSAEAHIIVVADLLMVRL